MKAIVCTAYGGPDVLKLEKVAKPRARDGEVLVRVHATTVSRADCEIRRFEFPAWIWLPIRLAFGVVRPRVRILGQDFAGEVEAVGDGATSFAPGDRVYGTTGIGLGAYAEYVRVGGRRPGSVVAPMPAAMSYVELLTAHIHKENGILFRMAEQLLPAASMRALQDRFDRFEQQAVESGCNRPHLEALEELGVKFLDAAA